MLALISAPTTWVKSRCGAVQQEHPDLLDADLDADKVEECIVIKRGQFQGVLGLDNRCRAPIKPECCMATPPAGGGVQLIPSRKAGS